LKHSDEATASEQQDEVSRPEWLAEFSDSIRAALQAHLAGELGPEMALLQVLMAVGSASEASQVLERAAQLAQRGPGQGLRRIERLQAMAREHSGAWQIVATTLELVDGVEPHAAIESESMRAVEMEPALARRIARLATRFDRAAECCPEASVALYSLGEPALLAAATAELVQRLRDWGLLRRDRCYLDIGCGAGRLEQALVPEVGLITGIDISANMIALARERCAGAPNVAFRLANGHDLDGFAAVSIDVILAVDSFPYLVRCDAGLAERHLSEAFRVLKPGGQMAIFNFSYGGDLGSDRSALAQLATRAGLTVVRNGVRGLRTWDGAGYHLLKSG
jgi:ubiquinone/menaquinone biosynthesis C-methylase UbiE